MPFLFLVLILLLADPVSAQSETAETYRNPVLSEQAKLDAIEKQDNFTILRHKPIYFAYNSDISKLQFSFRSPIAEDLSLYFGYSQLIFWRLNESSKPFFDATYNPEFFYRWVLGKKRLKHIDFGFWEHTSNGKDGLDSRSYNQSYIRAEYAYELSKWIIVLSGKARVIYDEDDSNLNIIDYAGPFALEFKLIQLFDGWWIDRSEFTVSVHPGGKFSDNFSRGGYQFGYNFRFGGVKVVPAFYLQYYRGYAETLLNYDQQVDIFRAGLLF